MEFLVKTTLGQEQIGAYQKAAGQTLERTKTLLLRGGLLVFGGLGLVTSCISLGMGFAEPGVFLGIGLGALALHWGLNWWRVQTRRLARRLAGATTEQEFYCTEEGIVARSGGQQVTHSYGELFALAETEKYYILFLSKRAGYVLDKAGFLTGDPAEFGAFIKERTGKELPFVKN